MTTMMHVVIWLVAIVMIGLLIKKRFPEIWKRPAPATAGTTENVAPAETRPPSPSLAGSLVDGLTQPLTWIAWLALFGGVWLYGPKLLAAPNLMWLPIGLWALSILVSRVRMASKIKNGGKEKKAAPGLTALNTAVSRLAFLSTLGVVLYYALLAPTGTWEKLTGRTSEHGIRGPGEMIIPEGVPLNPNFTSRKLEGWEVTYVAANPQYKVPQGAWSGKKIVLLKEPRREVADVVDLTVGFGQGQEALDIHLSGSCMAVLDNRRPQISKTCVGWWKDRWSQISGQFYLQVNEAGRSRYFDIYLYDGNYIPKKDQLAMMLYGPPIPAIMLQFRPKNWNEDRD